MTLAKSVLQSVDDSSAPTVLPEVFKNFDPDKKSLLLAGLSELMQQNYEDQIEALKAQIEHL